MWDYLVLKSSYIYIYIYIFFLNKKFHVKYYYATWYLNYADSSSHNNYLSAHEKESHHIYLFIYLLFRKKFIKLDFFNSFLCLKKKQMYTYLGYICLGSVSLLLFFSLSFCFVVMSSKDSLSYTQEKPRCVYK